MEILRKPTRNLLFLSAISTSIVGLTGCDKPKTDQKIFSDTPLQSNIEPAKTQHYQIIKEINKTVLKAPSIPFALTFPKGWSVTEVPETPKSEMITLLCTKHPFQKDPFERSNMTLILSFSKPNRQQITKTEKEKKELILKFLSGLVPKEGKILEPASLIKDQTAGKIFYTTKDANGESLTQKEYIFIQNQYLVTIRTTYKEKEEEKYKVELSKILTSLRKA
jgi:hypothetical protein